MVAFTSQVMPPFEAVSEDPVRAQSPDSSVHVNDPVDTPPVVVRDKVLPVVNESLLEISKADCDAFAIVIVVFAVCLTR